MTPNKPIIIAGIHRSGTSYLARCLHKAGIRMYHNDGGDHCEDQRLLSINERELDRQGLTFRDVSQDPIPNQDFIDELTAYKALREGEGAPVYGFKDPRIASLIDGYLQVWPDAMFAIAVRNLMSAGYSWKIRGNCKTSAEGSMFLGSQYLHFAKGVAGRKVLVFNYDRPDPVGMEGAVRKETGIDVDFMAAWSPRK